MDIPFLLFSVSQGHFCKFIVSQTVEWLILRKRIFVLQCKRNKDKDSAFRPLPLITIVWIINDWCVNITIKLSFPTCFSNRTACNWCSIIKADICRCNINKHQHQLILWSARLLMMMNLKILWWCLNSDKHIKATYLVHS